MTSLWMNIATFMVFLMQVGFLLLEAGSVRSKNSINVAQKNVSDMVICVVAYSLVGFSIMFGLSWGGFFGLGQVKTALTDSGGWPTFLLFNLAFCSVVATIVSGAVAERMKIGAYLISTACIATLVYPIFGHWVWGNSIITSNLAVLADLNFRDHAGGVAIHTLGGFFALAAIIVLGPRAGRFDADGNVLPITGHSAVLALSGALILFVTWIPFNTGSLQPGSQIFSNVALATLLAGSTGGLVGKIVGYFQQGRVFIPESSFNGILGGLVAVTSGVIFLGPIGAAVIGGIGGFVAIMGNHLILTKLKLDDPIGVVGVHGLAGITGAMLFPLLAIVPLPAGSVFGQVMSQGLGVGVCIMWALGTGFAIMLGLKALGVLRVSEAQEYFGLNFGEHLKGVTEEHLEAAYTATPSISNEVAADRAVTLSDNTNFNAEVPMSEVEYALAKITETHQNQTTELEKIGKVFEDALDSLDDGIFIYNSDFFVINFNDAAQNILSKFNVEIEKGMSRSSLVKEAIDEGMFPKLSNLPREDIAEVIETHSSSEIELATETSEYFLLRTKDTPSGGTIVTLTDITKIKKAQIAAEIAEQTKTEFLANMSHEIRTPMNGILGMTELLALTELNSRQRHFVNTVSKSGTALMTVINDILDFSILEAGQALLDPTPFQIREVIDDIVTLLSSAASEKGIDLIVRVAPNLPLTFMGDAGRIRQILTNLVGNAVKFTHHGHVLINVDGSAFDGQVALKILVEDTGIGIPESNLDDIFKKFRQVDGSTTRQYEGTGLGLSITSNLVALMGGDIQVDSHIDVGSIFTISLTLPVAEDVTSQKRQPFEVNGANVLIIDDNRINRDIFVEQLKHWKCNPLAVESGKHALTVLKNAKVKNIKFDLIIMDYKMPCMNGEDLFEALRAHSDFASIPVIMLTSVDEDKMIHRLVSNGLERAITKPVRASVLLDNMSDIIYQSKRHEVNNGIGFIVDGNPAANSDLNEEVEILDETQANMGTSDAQMFDSYDVLVAEDNETNQVYIRYILEELGVSYKIVSNGRQAIDAWSGYRPKVILMDVSMPELNGYEATQKIRSLEKRRHLPKTPIIAVTAHTLEGDAERCLSTGMDDYLSKPLSITNLERKFLDWGVLSAADDIKKQA